MKKLFGLLVMLATVFSAQAKCDWSGYWMKQVNQQQNVYTFQTNVDWDSCVDYWWIVYDYQLKKKDTLQDFNGYTQVQFNAKGRYDVILHVFDACNKCDTNFIQEIDITIYGKADVGSKVSIKNCRAYTFEMTNMNDDCIEYYYSIYKNDLFDSLYGYWDTAEDLYEWLYLNYDFDENDLVYYNTASQRVVNHEFIDSGRHLLIGYWYNTCTGIDTWVMKKVDVCVKQQTTSVKELTKEDLRNVTVVGYYDMLGRKVDYMEPNKIYIVLYSNGRSYKVMRTN